VKIALTLSTLVLAALGFAAAASAADYDGSKTLLCAPGEAVDCLPRGDCQQRGPNDLGIPRFITVDFKKKRLSGKTSDGEVKTAIQNVSSVDGKQILQGAENGRGWSLVIDEATGDMSAAIADQAAGFVLFGACTPK
jgi:hypothetical protein